MKIVRSLPKLDIDTRKDGSNGRTVDSIKEAIRSHWGKVPASDFALRIIDGISEKQLRDGDVLRVSDIVEMFNATELSGDLIAALTILAQSDFAILRAGGELVDDDGQRHELSPEDFQRVLDLDTVIHPISQKQVSQASEKVIPFFELETEIFGGANE